MYKNQDLIIDTRSYIDMSDVEKTTTWAEYEIIRTKKHRDFHMARAENLKQSTNCPSVLIEHELFMASMTYSEARAWRRRVEKELKAEHKVECEKYQKANPMKEEYVNLIYDRFDAWFAKYKNDSFKLEDELATHHHFHEPWFWGKIAPGGAEEEFYEKIFTGEDWNHGMYAPIFAVCHNVIRERLEELQDKFDYEKQSENTN